LVEETKKKREDEMKAKKEAAEKAQKEKEAAEKAAKGEVEEDATMEGEEDEKKEGEAEKPDEAMEDAEKKEEKEEEVKQEEEKKEEEEEEEEEEEPEVEKPDVELTEEDKLIFFKPQVVPDVSKATLRASFVKFSLPSKEEGFDAIQFEWQKETAATDYFKSWLLKTKLATPLEDLKPSDWFKQKQVAWQKALAGWQAKCRDFQVKDKEKKKLEAAKAGEADEKEGEEDDPRDTLDVFAVEDISDVGEGEPLFGRFEHEDWSLLTLRYDMHLLVNAFKHDVEDAEMPGMPEAHLAFYINKYFHKTIDPKYYALSTLAEVLKQVDDTVCIREENSTGFVESAVTQDADAIEHFVRLTEDARRNRQQRIDAGDETARIKFLKTMPAQLAPQQRPVAYASGSAAGGYHATAPGLSSSALQASMRVGGPRIAMKGGGGGVGGIGLGGGYSARPVGLGNPQWGAGPVGKGFAPKGSAQAQAQVGWV